MNRRSLRTVPMALLLTLFTGCTLSPTPAAPPPTHTPRPTATALPTATLPPTPTSVPLPPATATPSSGYYRNADLGFWFLYPDAWQREETGDDLPAVIISDDDDPVRLLAGAHPVEENTDLADFAAGVGDGLGLAEAVELVADHPATIAGGVPAWEVTFAWEDEDGRGYQAQGYTALAAGNGYVLLLVAHPEVLAARANTIEAIGRSLHLEHPELYGVSRANALVLMTPEPATLDPALTHEGPAGVVGHVFSGLVRLNADLQVEADLAEDWEISSDRRVYTFTLRRAATFHSGAPLTAEDVRRSWERATDPQLRSPAAARYLGDIAGVAAKLAGDAEAISGLEVVDQRTLVVTLDGPKPYLLFKLTQPVAFVVRADDVASGSSWWRRPDGSGPFVLSRWREEEAIVLERNEGHYQPPAISAVIYLLSSGSDFYAYEAGHVDAATVGPINLARVQDPADSLSADLVSGNTFCAYQVEFDTARAPFDDPAIRRAFSLAVDRQQLAQVTLNGAAIPATGFLPPGMPGYVERPADDGFDLGAAQALIDGSAYGDAADLPALTFTMPGVGEGDPLAVALADTWRANLGVTIETELVNPASYEDTIDFDHGHLFVVERCAAYPDPESVLDLPFHSAGPTNYGGYADEEVDALLEAARTEPDPAQRLDLYQDVERRLLDDAAAAPIVHPQSDVLVRSYVRGYRPSPIPVLWPAFVTIER